MLSGCAVKKDFWKEKRHVKETGVRVIEMVGDSVVYRPKVVYKDTTIVVRNKNIVLETTYKQGQVEKVKCKQDSIRVVENYQRQMNEQIMVRHTDREGFLWSDKYLLYAFLFLAGLVIINKITDKIL